MNTLPDLSLLREYADQGRQEPFDRLVRCHLDLVYSAALRQTRNHHLAEDVTQSVFLLLARKASALREEIFLSAWLLVSTRYIALETLRREARRRAHERKAAQMAQTLQPPADAWAQISDLLDEAMSRLSPPEREVIVLRYFKGQSPGQIALALGTSSDAAKQRVHRALGKLRNCLRRHGLAIAPPALARSLARNAVHPAPPHLGGMVLAHTVASSTLSKGGLLLMATTPTKIAAAVGLTALLASGGAAMLLKSPAPARDGPVIPAGLNAPADPNAPGDQDPNAWREEFDRVYKVPEGEAAQLVSPPYIPERQKFWDSQSNHGRAWNLRPQEHFVIRWDGNTPHWQSLSMSEDTFALFIQSGVKLKSYEFDDWEKAGLFKLPGDWVFRNDATVPQLLASAEQVVLQKLGRKIHFERKLVERDVVIVSGHFRIDPVVVEKPNMLVYSDHHDPRNDLPPLINDMTFPRLLDFFEGEMRKKIIDESDGAKERFKFMDDHPGNPKKAMDDLIRQTGLTLKTEKRQIEVWSLKEEPRP